MSIEAVVFDWGGTLTAPVEVIFELDTWGDVARHLAPERWEEVVERLTRLESEVWNRSRTDSSSTSLAALLEEMVTGSGLGADPGALTEAIRIHLDVLRPHIKHDPDAPNVLRELRSRGLRLGLLSNTLWPAHFHDDLLDQAGLLDLLDARFYTSHMDVTKPHPEAFHSVLRALSVTDSAAGVFVGDRPFDDIWGARNAGMKTVHRPNDLVPAHDVTPDAVIATLPALLDVLDGWA